MHQRRRRRRSQNRSAIVCGFGLVIALIGAHLIFTALLVQKPETHSPTESNNVRSKEMLLAPLREVDRTFYTVRINTWERPEQLTVSVNHHSQCKGAMQIQVVWCDAQHGEPPLEITQNSKVVIERHSANSLNERFNMLLPAPTMGILSIDDDVMRPCEAIDSGFFKWTQNPHRMVGFDARLHVEGPEKWAYGYMSTSEKANRYSLSLTRYCFLHRDYMHLYFHSLPRPMFDMVEESFNCEDIAMSFFISSLTDGRPPLLADYWAIKAMIKLYSKSKISSKSDHKKIRDVCVDSFAENLGLKNASTKLQTGKIQHPRFPHFECGETSGTVIAATEIKVPRHKALVEKVDRWKNASFQTFRDEVANMRNEISLQAWQHGFIEHSDPWKKRFGKK